MRLEDAVAFRDARLEVLERRLGKERPRRPYPLLDRLRLLWLIEYYQIPKRRVKETFGVARSSVHRWLKAFCAGHIATEPLQSDSHSSVRFVGFPIRCILSARAPSSHQHSCVERHLTPRTRARLPFRPVGTSPRR